MLLQAWSGNSWELRPHQNNPAGRNGKGSSKPYQLSDLCSQALQEEKQNRILQHIGFLACGVMSTFHDLRSNDSH